MKTADVVREEHRCEKERESAEPDPLFRAVHNDRARTLEWVLGD